ncbi:hypothetical protein CMV_016201 [Castanea mollissima]|uniref:EGF-like domain-containing protein n=1 Tax=Castanea mollissima TaxID=60419 RepID=A0A8J4QUA5_9ROSI|nr:hypothetical protein CMV_016201 [Castanea mollissima]
MLTLIFVYDLVSLSSILNPTVTNYGCNIHFCPKTTSSEQIVTNMSYVISATNLKPYDWRYSKVELPPPPFYASASIELSSNVNLNLEHIDKYPKMKLPIICFHFGGPPLPDVSNTAIEDLVLNDLPSGSVGDIQNLQHEEQCYPLQEMMTFKLSSLQITPGVYYIGLFNGFGPIRTQSKMINRGSAYSFTANITVEGCLNPRMWGEYCNQAVDDLSMEQSNGRYNEIVESIAYRNYSRTICSQKFDVDAYALTVMEAVEQVRITAKNISEASTNSREFSIMLYARYNALPDKISHDYTTDISEDPLVIQLPRSGVWYFAIEPVFKSNVQQGMQKGNIEPCYLVEWEVIACMQEKAVSNCTWKQHVLQAIPYQNQIVYLPDRGNVSSESVDFYLEPYLSKSSYGNAHGSDYGWTYFLLYTEQGTEGLWIIGLRHPVDLNNQSSPQTMMTISTDSCPNQCSGHGKCVFKKDLSESADYSYCSCDRNYGGFDCSVTLLSKAERRLQVIFLIASNAAALLPAFKVFQQKAFAEWVIFMSSGISSALYHACDVGSWCALSYSVLQFMDFWLSFLAVVSTFVYLTIFSETAKRTIHTAAAIITALIAESGATRSNNIIIVLSIGALAFLVGWLIQLCTQCKSFSFPVGSSLKITERWRSSKDQLLGLMMAIYRYFRWGYVLLGVIAMSMAAISWIKEASETYWIWHSIWHISIYTSAFFFICSKAKTQNVDNQEAPAAASYELTRQESFARCKCSGFRVHSAINLPRCHTQGKEGLYRHGTLFRLLGDAVGQGHDHCQGLGEAGPGVRIL